jgi:hypothetical protein
VSRVALGWTNKQIAKDLDISPATVKTLLERLFRVSGSSNRAGLVQWWHDGLATPKVRTGWVSVSHCGRHFFASSEWSFCGLTHRCSRHRKACALRRHPRSGHLGNSCA